MNNKKRVKIGLPILLLVCFCLLSIYIATNTTAKYTSTESGTDSGRVAIWNTSSDLGSNSINLICGDSAQSCTITVTNTSEVSNTYSLILSNVPNDITVSIDGGSEQSPSNEQVTFNNAGSFIIGSGITSRNHTITFNAPLESNENTNNVSVNVIFTQID